MNGMHLFAALLFFYLTGFPFSSASTTYRQQPPAAALVKVHGLQPSYSSCSLVDFTVLNDSKLEFYAEVYVEDFDSGSWEVHTSPYNLHEPISLYQKLVFTQADKLRGGGSWKISYDRCLRPTYVKESNAAFRGAIIEKDANARSPVLQRIRVDIYLGEPGKPKAERHVWSDPFKRIPERKR